MKLCDKNQCTGCSACANVCPKQAITLEYNERGFLEPKIDKEKCINCNMCQKLCEKLNHHLEEENHTDNFYMAYAVKIKDDKKRMESQSGGLFTALAETILENNGIVYGAGLDKNKYVKHYRITNINDLHKIKKSKYVQSNLNNSFKSIVDDLKNDKLVLFSGTPCQVAGIESLLDFKKINKEKFFSCDVICHGIPSPKFYEKFIDFLERKNNDKIENFNFRDKTINGWYNHIETYNFENDKSKKKSKIYCDIFYSNLILRKSCESCKYTRKNRPGDITMADCWGIEKINPNLWNDNKGISACLIQTNHGEKLFKMASNKLDLYELENGYNQMNLNKSSTIPYQKDNFWNDYNSLSFDKLLKKYTTYGGLKFRIKRKILKILKRW